MNNIIQSPSSCQGKSAFRFFEEFPTKYCQDLLKIENCPWGKNSNPIQFYISLGHTKISKNQKVLINFFHREYFSRGKACWLKRRNIIKQSKVNPKMKPCNLTRVIGELVKRGILIKLTMETNKFKRIYLLPNIQSEKQIQKEFKEFEKENKDIMFSYENYNKFIR